MLLKYYNFLNIFFRDEANKLLLYRLNNYKIKLKFEIESNYNFLYLISQNKLKILRKYLDDNLIKRFIRSSFSSIVSPVLFIKKSSEELRLYVNYRALNAIIIKNRYSLSLI